MGEAHPCLEGVSAESWRHGEAEFQLVATVWEEMDAVAHVDESPAKHAANADAWRRAERISSRCLVSAERRKRVEGSFSELVSAVVSVATGFANSKPDRPGLRVLRVCW